MAEATKTQQKTFYIETFGCQMNVHDTEKVAGLLLEQGYQPADSADDADMVFLNTCAIRDKATHKVFSRLGNLKADAVAGKKTIGLLGCMAQLEGEKIFKATPFVSLVAGSASYNRLPEMLVQLEAGQQRVTGLEYDDDVFETELTRRSSKYRGYITIIEGCNKSCAYCVVPFTRGPERSRASESVLEEAGKLLGQGYTEIQLLGQNVNSYRDPSPRQMSFAELISAIAELPGLKRLRFMTSHPWDFTPEIVRAIEDHPALCDHVHLPVQSGSSEVLRRMNRAYTREEYLEKISWLKAARRPISLSTDIITGFPGESQADFAQTMTLLDEVRYDGLFSFIYSPRPNTPALTLPYAIPDEEKSRRIVALQTRQREIQLERNRQFIGRTVEVMVEGHNPRRDQFIGRTSSNRVVNFKSGDEKLGSYRNVRITGAGPSSLIAEVAEAVP